MLHYFDSSVVLAMLLDESRGEEAAAMWNGASIRVSSILLRLETLTVIRRTYEHNKSRLGRDWIGRATRALAERMKEVNIRTVDDEIEKIFELDSRLARCRTLDAIHLATALEFSRMSPSTALSFYTFDREMAEAAKSLKFVVVSGKQEELL